MDWKELTEKDCREWKLTTVDPQERGTWRSGVRSATHPASQLPGRGPNDDDDYNTQFSLALWLWLYIYCYLQGSHELLKTWKNWKITKKKFHACKNHGI